MSYNKLMLKKLSSVVGSMIILLIIGLLFSQRQYVKDFYIVHTSELQSRSKIVGEQIALTDEANFIFQASQPEIQPATQFNQSCRGVSKEYSIVLGCYTQQKLFVFEVSDTRLDGVIQVTVAHELLHAVYERLGQKEKNDIDTKLSAFAATVQDKRFNDTVEQYKKAEPDHVANELHSMVGTELADLPPEIENYYRRYFTNRVAVVTFAKQYENALEQFSSDIKAYDQELRSLEAQKDTLETSLKQQEQLVQSEDDRLSALRSSGDTQSYNRAVPGFNTSIQGFNSDVSRLKQIVATYNDLVEKRNAVATSQNDLVKKLDSSYQPIN